MYRNVSSTAEHGAPGKQALDRLSRVKDPIVEALGRHRGPTLEPFGLYRCVSVGPDYDDKVADGCGEGWTVYKRTSRALTPRLCDVASRTSKGHVHDLGCVM